MDLDRIVEEDNEEFLTKANWLQKSANSHSLLGNKLNSISKRMHVNEKETAATGSCTRNAS